MRADLSPSGFVAEARDGAPARAPRVSPEVLLVAGLTVLAAGLRFATLTDQSFWFDEAQAVHEMHLSFGAMLGAWSRGEPNPPLFFVLAWPWARVFGAGEAGLRSFSALLGTALVPLIYLCGRELVSRRAGLFAALLAALSPLMIWYSQEAREYMLLSVLAAASLLTFARAQRHPTPRSLAWWAGFSGLALLTQYFAAFLVAAEAVLLIYRARTRASLVAAGAMGVIEAALIPHLVGHVSHPAGWIDAFPLSVRIQQTPVAFGLNTLYRSPAVSYGLLGAAGLASGLIVLLVLGEDDRGRLRGAAIAAGLAGAVVLVPLGLALLGADYYEARALIPGWIPLAVVIGAACAARRTRVAGAVLAAVLCVAFVYAGLRINDTPAYQRPDWRGVAAALGRPVSRRAIVAYDGEFAAAPLAIDLPGIPWTGPGQIPQISQAPVTIAEVDVVGSIYDQLAKLPPGVRLIGRRSVDSYEVDRFALAAPWHLSPSAIGARAARLLAPGSPGPAVLIQRPFSVRFAP